VTELSKSINISRSYRHEYGVLFFLTHSVEEVWKNVKNCSRINLTFCFSLWGTLSPILPTCTLPRGPPRGLPSPVPLTPLLLCTFLDQTREPYPL